jgi:hypothetical protein
MNIKFWIVMSVLVVGDGVLSYFLGENLSVTEMLLYLDSLLVVSAIIFGIVGAWLAIIWQNTRLPGQEQHENILYLKKTVFCSFVVIAFSLAVKFIYPLVKNTTLLSNNIAIIWLKRVFIFTSGVFGLILMVSLFLSLLSFDFFAFNNEIEKQRKEQELEFRKGRMSQVNNIREVK